LEEIVTATVNKTETTTGGIRWADHTTPSIPKSWHYFANKRRSLGRHSSLADQSHGVFLLSAVSTDNLSPDPILLTTALEGQVEVTISLNMHVYLVFSTTVKPQYRLKHRYLSPTFIAIIFWFYS
jgi:hypothetical protein